MYLLPFRFFFSLHPPFYILYTKRVVLILVDLRIYLCISFYNDEAPRWSLLRITERNFIILRYALFRIRYGFGSSRVIFRVFSNDEEFDHF